MASKVFPDPCSLDKYFINKHMFCLSVNATSPKNPELIQLLNLKAFSLGPVYDSLNSPYHPKGKYLTQVVKRKGRGRAIVVL